MEILHICKLFAYQIEGSAFANVQKYAYVHTIKNMFLPREKFTQIQTQEYILQKSFQLELANTRKYGHISILKLQFIFLLKHMDL